MLDELSPYASIANLRIDEKIVQVNHIFVGRSGGMGIPMDKADGRALILIVYCNGSVHLDICVQKASESDFGDGLWDLSLVERVVLLPEILPVAFVVFLERPDVRWHDDRIVAGLFVRGKLCEIVTFVDAWR